jgi:hypothetical protein
VAASKPKNLAESVRQRLVNLAHARGEEAQALLIRYGVERFLYRLTRTPDGDRFVLKGALLFTIWDNTPTRPTADADLLGPGLGTPATIRTYFQTVCATAVEPDGLVFQPNTVKAERIREDQEHDGVRVRVVAKLGKAEITVKVDVGFGDVITPAPIAATLPPLLDFPPAQIRAYPPETAVAEKCHAIVNRGATNTRMKDYYDLYVLSEVRDFDGALLAAAVAATFKRRAHELPSDTAIGLTAAFGENGGKQRQWSAFLKQRGLRPLPSDLATVVQRVAGFLQPVIDAARGNGVWQARWPAGRDWTTARDD